MGDLAAPSALPARPRRGGALANELIRAARLRTEEEHIERRARWTFVAVGTAFAVAATASALLLADGPAFSWKTAAFFVVLYAIVSRVEFEIGTGAAIPTQLVLVPMLFALPVGCVPALVAIALVVALVATPPHRIQPQRVFVQLASATQTLGPVLVLALANGTPLRAEAWPVYVAALAAQFAFDFASAAVGSVYGHRVRLRSMTRFLGWVFVVDAALAPVGLAVAFAIQDHAALAVLVLPLVVLLRHFSHERRRRIDHALELSDAYRGTAFLLGDVVEADDAYTGSHSRHVVDLVLGVCDELALAPEERRNAEFVALLHDVGKIRIPPEIINKPGPLDDAERALMRLHTIEGERMLERVGGLLGEVGQLVRSCHEFYDGNGYPDALAGEAIPLIARIVCACDAFSAMTTDRPYRGALSQDDALAELERCSGSQFDPRVVVAIVRLARVGL